MDLLGTQGNTFLEHPLHFLARKHRANVEALEV